MGFASVAHRVQHRLPRPTICDCCGGSNVALQKRELLRLRTYGRWDLIWYCGDCGALVGCHEGTDIPMGRMADADTRRGRYEAHNTFDRLWRGRSASMSRAQAYAWMASTLGIPIERAHISMLTADECAKLVAAVLNYRHNKKHERHWSQDKRKRRRK